MAVDNRVAQKRTARRPSWHRVVIGGLVVLAVAPLVLVLVFWAGAAAGLPFDYESAPEGATPPGLLTQLTLMHWIAAPVMLAVSATCARFARVAGAGAGLRVGLLWAGAYVLVQAVLALGQAVVSSLSVSGAWGLVAAIALGPVLAGALRARRDDRTVASGP